MAKTRPTVKPKGKDPRTISTSALFKHRDQIPRKERRKLTGLRLLPSSRIHKPRRKPQHPLSATLDETLQKSHTTFEEKSQSRLDNIRDRLITQTQVILEDARNRILEATNSSQDLQKPIEEAVLEFTHKDGTVTATSLGDRMHAYRKMVNREQKKLDELFTQRADVEKSIDDLFAEILGSKDSQDFFKAPKAVTPMPDQVAQERLLEELEAEKQRVKDASEALGKKAIKAMEAGEKELGTKYKQQMQKLWLQLCQSMDAENDD
ncbi:MAG: hypothetical protein Q9183_000446 [Haloplaca sp. 2 TL-2023]